MRVMFRWLIDFILGREIKEFLEEEQTLRPHEMPFEPEPPPRSGDEGNTGFAERLRQEESDNHGNTDGYQRALERSLANEQREAAKSPEPEGRGR